MGKTTITTAHSLRLIPVQFLIGFAMVGNRVKLVEGQDSFDACAVPGSIEISEDDNGDGTIGKEIRYKRAEVDGTTAAELELMGGQRLVALYIDGLGNARVCGSPTYCLRMQWEEEDGVYNIKLLGTEDAHNRFVI